jgi:opacity protein-like surface antigen
MRLHTPLLVAGLTLALASAAGAQPAQSPNPLSQSDVALTIGWFNADKSGLSRYGEWYNRSVHGAGTFGWYWTDHHKTEVEAGGTSKASLRVFEYEVVANRQVNRESTYSFSTRRFAVAQHYQFYRNVMFHPYLGAGVDLTWETAREERGRESVYDTITRQQLPGRPPEAFPPRTELVTRPFAALGFKAYMTPRSFFRTDLKLVMRNGIDEVFVRAGFGVDF